MHGLLNDKVAIITGAATGIGLASAERFAEAGARIIISDINDEAGEAIARRLGHGVAYVRADITQEADIAALVDAAVSRFGKLDVMYNNAATVGDTSPFVDLEGPGFDLSMATAAKSVFFGHKYAAKQFLAQGGGGSIVTTGSVAGLQGGWSTLGYTAAKHTVAGIVRQAASELAPHGIRSNAIAPGVVMTSIQARAFGVPVEHGARFNSYIEDRLGARQAMGRFGKPDDIAKAALFFASDLSSYVTGTIMPVDGGASNVTQNTFMTEMLEVTEDFLATIQA